MLQDPKIVRLTFSCKIFIQEQCQITIGFRKAIKAKMTPDQTSPALVSKFSYGSPFELLRHLNFDQSTKWKWVWSEVTTLESKLWLGCRGKEYEKKNKSCDFRSWAALNPSCKKYFTVIDDVNLNEIQNVLISSSYYKVSLLLAKMYRL